jgi:AcrR family transcriptional regulator
MVNILGVHGLPLHHEKWFNRKWREPPLNIRRCPPFCKCYFRSATVKRESQANGVNRKQTAPARKPRADSARNRQLLIDAAKGGFAEVGLNVSLEEIARRAGVGIGTLYRHFPSREAVVEAVYRREVEQLVEAVPQLLETSPAGEALHQWMHLFVNYIATKRLIAPSLSAAIVRSSAPHATPAELITRAIATLVKGAVRSGDVRKDIDPSDLLRALVGVSYGNPDAGWEASARRLIDILMDGLRRKDR